MPNQSKTDTPIIAINFCPICGSRVQRSAVVDLAEPLARWPVHCRDGAWAHITARGGVAMVVFMVRASWPSDAGEIDRAFTFDARHRITGRDVMKETR